MIGFIYNGRTYIRVVPGKRLFQSTMVHEVVNRGDIFGMDIANQTMTIIPGKAQVQHITIDCIPEIIAPAQAELDLGGL